MKTLTDATLELAYQKIEYLGYELSDNGLYNIEQIKALEALIIIGIRPNLYYIDVLEFLQSVFNNPSVLNMKIDDNMRKEYHRLRDKFNKINPKKQTDIEVNNK